MTYKIQLSTLSTAEKQAADAVLAKSKPGYMGRVWGWFQPSKNPADVLSRVDILAQKGLEKAAVRGIEPGFHANELKADLDHEALVEDPNANLEGAPPPGNISLIKDDPEITPPIPLQTRVEEIDWKKQMQTNQRELTNKLSAFTALIQMRDRCGIVETDNFNLIQIVQKFTQGDRKKTLWNYFNEHYKGLSLFQKISAGFFYWIYYQTSIISNTVHAYLDSSIKGLTSDLIKENSDARSSFFRTFLENSNQFLVKDYGAIKAFAYADNPWGDLSDYQDDAIDQVYDGDLAGLCKKFSKARVEADSPNVRFFKTLQDIPVFGLFFRAFEWVLNRFIIQKSMKSWILPEVLTSAVNNGIEATKPHNIPFALNFTRFINIQLERFRVELEEGAPSEDLPAAPFPGTEMLSPTIKNLLRSLEVEKFKTQSDLKAKIEQLEKGKWKPDAILEEVIQTGIVDACNLLFKMLNEKAISGELFAHLLELSAAPFSGELKTQAQLKEEYDEEESRLNRNTKSVIKKIISNAIDKNLGLAPSNAPAIADQAFDKRKTVAQVSIDRLYALCSEMQKKVAAADPSDEKNSIKADIATLFEIMRVLANRKEVQAKIDGLSSAEQQAIWAELIPLYERLSALEEKALHLQEIQDQCPANASVANELRFIKELFETIPGQFTDKPCHLLNPFDPSMKASAKKIETILGENTPVPTKLMKTIDELSEFSEKIAYDQTILNAIYALYPPRIPGQQVAEEGLLGQLLNYQRGVYPRGFKPRDCLKEINKQLEHFPMEERRALQALIQNGSNLTAKWSSIGQILQRLQDQHTALKARRMAELNEKITQENQWLEKKASVYDRMKTDAHNEMKKMMGEISLDVQVLKRESEGVKFQFPKYWTEGKKQALFGGLGAAAMGTVASAIGWLAGGPVGGFIGAALPAVAPNLGDLVNKEKPKGLKTTAVTGFAGAAASLLHPLAPMAVGALSGGYAGTQYRKIAHQVSQDVVQPKVLTTFENAFDMFLSPRIYKALATRSLVALTGYKAKRPRQ